MRNNTRDYKLFLHWFFIMVCLKMLPEFKKKTGKNAAQVKIKCNEVIWCMKTRGSDILNWKTRNIVEETLAPRDGNMLCHGPNKVYNLSIIILLLNVFTMLVTIQIIYSWSKMREYNLYGNVLCVFFSVRNFSQ